jgi:hypothetical protein
MFDFRLIMVEAEETINTLCRMWKIPIEAQIRGCQWTCSYNPYKIPRICIEFVEIQYNILVIHPKMEFLKP